VSPFTCAREPETIRAAWSGAWPSGCDHELREHVAGCAVCRDAVGLAAVFREERQGAAREARVPASGVVWWRAQLRVRREAARTADTPVAVAQGLALARGLVAVVAVLLALLPSVRAVFRAMAASLPSPADLASSLPSATGALSGLSAASLLAQPGILIVLAATLLLAPVAVYLALAKE
jgi:hypothetical protein